MGRFSREAEDVSSTSYDGFYRENCQNLLQIPNHNGVIEAYLKMPPNTIIEIMEVNSVMFYRSRCNFIDQRVIYKL